MAKRQHSVALAIAQPERELHLQRRDRMIQLAQSNLSLQDRQQIIHEQMNIRHFLTQSLRSASKYLLSAIGATVIVIAATSCSSIEVPRGEDLKGMWSQTGAGFESGGPVTWENQTVVIETTKGQGFTGYKEYTRQGERPRKEIVNGVIGLNGDILIVDEDGTFAGRFVGGKLRGQYAEVGADAAAINVELARE